MTKRKPELWIPMLYVVLLIVVNIVSAGLYITSSIDDEVMRMIRIGSISNLFFYGSLTVLYIVLFIPAWRSTIKHFNKNKSTMGTQIALGIGLMVVAMLVLGNLYVFLGIEETSENQAILEQALNGPLFDRISLAVFAILFAPLVEELVFRLAGFRILRKFKWMPEWGVIVITAILFGLIHVLGDNIIQIIYYAGLGLVLGWSYYKSNNILVPIAIHLIYNGFVTVTMFLGF